MISEEEVEESIQYKMQKFLFSDLSKLPSVDAQNKIKTNQNCFSASPGAAILMWNEVIFVGEGFYNLLISSFITEQWAVLFLMRAKTERD